MISRQKINQYWRKYSSMAHAMSESPMPYDRANSELARLAAELWRAASVGQVEESDWKDNPSIKSYDSSVTFDPRQPLEDFKNAWEKYCKSGVVSGDVVKMIDVAMRADDGSGMAKPPPPKKTLDYRIPAELREHVHADAAQAIILEYESEFGLDRLEGWEPPEMPSGMTVLPPTSASPAASAAGGGTMTAASRPSKGAGAGTAGGSS